MCDELLPDNNFSYFLEKLKEIWANPNAHRPCQLVLTESQIETIVLLLRIFCKETDTALIPSDLPVYIRQVLWQEAIRVNQLALKLDEVIFKK